MNEWLRKKIVKWLRVPLYTETFIINGCYFVRESPGDVPYMEKIGEVIRSYTGDKQVALNKKIENATS